MWTSTLAYLALLALAWSVTCADAVRCDGGGVPCLTASGVYGCCEQPNDLSLSDEQCAKGYQHGPDGTTCIKTEGHAEAIVCPDGESECPDETTCCQLPDSSWGCCPMVEAVCCEDKRHCCPQGTKCDIAHSKCVSPTLEETLMYMKFPAKRRLSEEEHVASAAGIAAAIICPDGKSLCPDGTTCCQMTSGSYGCCLFPNAVCCTDHLHCCPGNTTCDLAHQMCVSSDGQTPLAKHFPAVLGDVVCPDQVSRCPDETTCCMLNNGSYGCCPMPRAVCCSDHLHCCPEGTTCDLVHSTCVSPSGSSTTWAHKLPATRVPPAESRVIVVPCNDSVACPSDTTCCKTEQGWWACCPFSQAVCCSDHIHCCPQNTVCNLSAGSCDTFTSSVSWLDKLQSSTWTPSKVGSKCNSTASCPDDETCCKSTSGAWTCCPLSQAVCCEDHVHCCPHDTVCNLAAKTCDDPSGSVPWLEKVPPIAAGSLDEKCNEQSVCPSRTTCCQQNSGRWACCPLPHAVCCDDHEHCCPKGYKCDVSQQTCEMPGSLSLPWFKKQPALQKSPIEAVDSSSVLTEGNPCDSHTSCPRDNTCCYMKKMNKWGCCPLPRAVCCENGEHCCPHGYQCDPAQRSCIRGGLVIPWYRKVEALSSTALPKDVKCDTETSCAAGTTCCRLPTGQWGCCPLVKAVCCADHEHCCPQGYTCNMKAGTCEKDGGHQDVPVTQVSLAISEDPQCSGCSDSETCCRTSANTWACCPSPKAVCCSDMKHCCPMGYSCDPAAGSCRRTQELTWHSLAALERRAFVPV